MAAYNVKRAYNKWNSDYLVGFDLIWGPIWGGSRTNAVPFTTATAAESAMDDAVACMRPVAWRVPDFGSSSTLSVSEA
jgi:hypothetical protein